VTKRFAAVDLGASSGRVMAVDIAADTLTIDEVHRFPNGPVAVGERLHWDVLMLFRETLEGLRQAGPVDAVGIDGWAVDYGLLDSEGALLGNPYHYRDGRTDGVTDKVHAVVGADELYAATGIQVQPFNTVYQLSAATGGQQLAIADTLLLIPDLLNYWLTGHRSTELTNASTTGLLDSRTHMWATRMMGELGINPALFTPLIPPGTVLGPVSEAVRTNAGLPGCPQVIAVGSHDTASAVAAVPADTPHFAYVATGTWSLVGVELDAPVLTEQSRAANFTNEVGVFGTVRFLRNVMGLWLLQECLRECPEVDLDELLAAAGREPGLGHVIDAADPQFLAPGEMTSRIADACHRLGQDAPNTPAAFVRTILDSLALAHAQAVREAAELSGARIDVVHLVGGGARNALLCQLTADACGRPVVAGPVEAAAVGNALMQAHTLGVVRGGLTALRQLVANNLPLLRYEPAADQSAWSAAHARLIAHRGY
jgi:rhamnulokinase